MAFAPDTGTDVRDLIESESVLDYSRSGAFERITGDFRVLAVLMPDGSIRVGPNGELASSSVRLSRGSWTGGVYLDDDEGGQPIRIRFRPRTGVLVVEDLQ